MSYLAISRKRLDEFLAQVLSERFGFPRLYEAMCYSVLNGGKRIRASFVYLIGLQLKVDPVVLDVLAASVEMLHAFSLIHDDLPGMDNDTMRRGKPSCHIAFGEDLAILAGDALHTEAFCLLSRADALQKIHASERLKMIEYLSVAVGAEGMVSGQAMDMSFQRTGAKLEELSLCHQLKTGRLLKASIMLPVIASGMEERGPRYQAYQRFGDLVGFAFQIQDDILDQIATTEELGKTAGKDRAQNKVTFPQLIGLQESETRVQQLGQEAIALLQKWDCCSDELFDFIQALFGRRA